jgi:hypothetical protein
MASDVAASPLANHSCFDSPLVREVELQNNKPPRILRSTYCQVCTRDISTTEIKEMVDAIAEGKEGTLVIVVRVSHQ